MNGTVNDKVESTLAKYLEFRVFEMFKNRMVPVIKPHCRENSIEDVYQHMFLCPANLSKKRNFQLHGVLSPFVCLWRTSPLNWNKKKYGRSVLPREFYYTNKNGQTACERGFMYDVEIEFELFSSSYYKSFRDRVNQNILDLDRLRYFDINVPELLKDCECMKTRAEFMLEGLQSTDTIQDGNNNRSFDLNCKYKVSITVPYCHSFDYIERVEIYLNDNKIFEKEVEPIEDSSSQTSQP
jgi:hypothetical protein